MKLSSFEIFQVFNFKTPESRGRVVMLSSAILSSIFGYLTTGIFYTSFLIGNDIDIVDYKFSTLKVDVLKEKYAEQLALYKKAVESAFGKSVKNTYIYSINTGELK